MLVITTKTYNNDIHVVDDIWLMRPLDLAAAQHNAVTESLLKSWQKEPFSDIIVVDQERGSFAVCPSTHPNELLLNVWPGTRHICDCLERNGAGGRVVYPNMEC